MYSGMRGSAYWGAALELFFVLFALFGAGCARSVSIMIRRRAELGDIRNARLIAGRSLGTAFFVSLFLAGGRLRAGFFPVRYAV
ncbi:MAG: hypothetical protein ACLTQL_09040 [Eisenbergiella sp.]